MSVSSIALTKDEAGALVLGTGATVLTAAQISKLVADGALIQFGPTIAQGASSVLASVGQAGSTIINGAIAGAKSVAGAVATDISAVAGSATELALTPVGAVGTLTASQALVAGLACLSAGIVGYQAGVTIEEAVNRLSPGFRERFYTWILGEYTDGLIPTVEIDGITYVAEYVLNNIKDFLIQEGVFDTATHVINIPANTTERITSLVNTDAISLQFQTYFNELEPPTQQSINAKEDYISNFGLPTIALILSQAASAGAYISAITDNDLLQITGATSGNLVNFSLRIARNVLNRVFSTEQLVGTDYPYINTSRQVLNYLYIADSVGEIIYDSLNLSYNSTYHTFSANVSSQTKSDQLAFDIPSYAVSSWNFGTSEAIPGIIIQPGVATPTLEDDITTTYPEWAAEKEIIGGIDSEGVLTNTTYLPVTVPTDDVAVTDVGNAWTGSLTDAQLQTITQTLTQTLIDAGVIAVPTTAPIAQITPTPVMVLPSISQTGMTQIYVPTASQLQSFSSFLWSNDFFDNVIKILQDPMDAIISLHRIYMTPTTSGQANIVLGKISSNVQSNYTNTQYYQIDCGNVDLPEYFGDATDYEGFTKVDVYLPFIGVKPLKTNDVVNSNIGIKYKVDILTGNCIAEITVKKNGVSQLLYTFTGNCAEQVPLTGANYTSLIMGAASMAAGIATGGLAGAAGLVGGAKSLLSGMSNTVEKSGRLDGNYGAMSIKQPYLIVNRTVPDNAQDYNIKYGYPSNNVVRINNCEGYTKVKSVHVEGIQATNKEKDMIEKILKDGFIA